MDKLAALAEKRRVEREAAHARAVVGINTAVEAAEQVETTPQALMASYHDLRAIGVGRGDWASLVQQIGGYGPSLQEAIVRLGARKARTLAALATLGQPHDARVGGDWVPLGATHAAWRGRRRRRRRGHAAPCVPARVPAGDGA